MYELKKKLERYLQVNLLGPGSRLIKKKNLPGRGLTKVEKHWRRPSFVSPRTQTAALLTFRCRVALIVSELDSQQTGH
jgi:hypothetical protein